MSFNFDEIVSRKGTGSVKHEIAPMYCGSADTLPMWVADMDFRTPPFIIDALQQRLSHEILGYTIREDNYFQAIINWLQRRHQWTIEKDWICFVPGVVPAFNLAVLAFTKEGDKIITQPPVYAPFYHAATDHKRELLYNPLKQVNGSYEMDYEDLEQKCASGAKMLILCSPHNPVGRVWTSDELRRMAEICRKYNVLIFSDEIHCDLLYPGFKHTPTASLSPEIADCVITAISASKTFNVSGLSTASTIISNESLRNQFNQLVNAMHIGLGNIFGNIAAEAAYTHGDAWLGELMQYLQGNVDFLDDFCKTQIPQIEVIRPEATFLVWLDCRKLNLSDAELKQLFVEKAKLCLNFGTEFNPNGNGFMRINIGAPRATLQKALEQLKEALI